MWTLALIESAMKGCYAAVDAFWIMTRLKDRMGANIGSITSNSWVWIYISLLSINNEAVSIPQLSWQGMPSVMVAWRKLVQNGLLENKKEQMVVEGYICGLQPKILIKWPSMSSGDVDSSSNQILNIEVANLKNLSNMNQDILVHE